MARKAKRLLALLLALLLCVSLLPATALAEGERLRRLLTGHTEELRRFFSEQFVRLLPELDAP